MSNSSVVAIKLAIIFVALGLWIYSAIRRSKILPLLYLIVGRDLLTILERFQLENSIYGGGPGKWSER
ncbi:hypothetical protein [Sphingomonas sp.]|uniref:hypothetical protein n=1 Tax=Sphingomonas sp. TaxID=28214 RepID=UPI002B7DD5A0|nr:hypothetical protein [Sphingomonas sp.]HTG37634.1 hypothetical protein [Sphingomonas sp.]